MSSLVRNVYGEQRVFYYKNYRVGKYLLTLYDVIFILIAHKISFN